ncbi:ATP-binding protein [Frankia sp. Cr1]|uniref:ATP-binding protein n=1 Tax=Frankia sp. Cr1 TaxID=3073931 RepID=UPI002AD57550|nr:ATP-binding protein [Frankia sp. Cr1]
MTFRILTVRGKGSSRNSPPERSQLTIQLPAVPQSAAKARAALAEMLLRMQLADLVDDASLLVSEMVTNAIIHGSGDQILRADFTAGRLRVTVDDQNSTLISRQSDTREEDERGRGLMLVDALAHAWGVEAMPTGKRVWFELYVTEKLPPPCQE